MKFMIYVFSIFQDYIYIQVSSYNIFREVWFIISEDIMYICTTHIGLLREISGICHEHGVMCIGRTLDWNVVCY